MLWFISIVCALFGLGGFLLIFAKSITGRAIFKLAGIEIDAPVGVAVLLAALYALSICAQQYNLSLQKEIDRLTVAKQEDEAKLNKTQSKLEEENKELGATNTKLQQEQSKTEELKKQLTEETAKRRSAEEETSAAIEGANRLTLSDEQKAEFDRLQQGVLKLNDQLTVLRIQPTAFPIIEERKAKAVFEIYQKEFESDRHSARGAGLFDFASKEYKIKMLFGNQEGIPANTESEITTAICDAAKSAAIRSIPLKDAIDRAPSFRGFDINRQLFHVLTEYCYIQMQLKLMASEALVLVRGYADGELSDWRESLKGAVYKIEVHENAHPDSPESTDGLVFREQLTPVSIGVEKKDYGNEDLPNLRAAEVSALLNALIHCPEPEPNTSVGSVAVQILEGRVYPAHRELDRKVRVHLLVFLKQK